MATEKGAEKAPTLDEVYATYGVTGDEQQRQTAQSGQQTAKPAAGGEGDSELARDMAALRESIGALRAENEAIRRDAQTRQEKADLQGVLDKLGNKLEGVKSNHIKYALAERYETDPRFKQVWDGRADNPQAFDAALNALVPSLAEELSVRADPKIAEDQRAFDNALQSADSGPASEGDEETHRLMKMNEVDFDNAWRKLVNMG